MWQSGQLHLSLLNPHLPPFPKSSYNLEIETIPLKLQKPTFVSQITDPVKAQALEKHVFTLL